jgi:hypothetical protein
MSTLPQKAEPNSGVVGCQNLRSPRWQSVCAPPQLLSKVATIRRQFGNEKGGARRVTEATGAAG